MLKRLSMIALAVPALLMGGCAGSIADNRGLESAHQPVVQRADYVFDMNTDNGRPSPGEFQRLSGWLASLRLGYGDRVALDDPTGANSAARIDVSAALARYGLFLADSVPVSATQPNPGTVRVVVSRTKASVPSCPDHRDTGNGNFNGHTSSNHGCAVNSNLAAMVAQPDDLVRGQPGSATSDPAIGTRAIQSLRRGLGSGGAGAAGNGGGAAAGSSGGANSGGGVN